MLGTLHWYEGYEEEALVWQVSLLAALGIKHIIAYNASGAFYWPNGTLVVICDHISIPRLSGKGPLRDESRPIDFPYPSYHSNSLAWTLKAASRMHNAAFKGILGGIYAQAEGPSYETPTELPLFKLLRVDVVRMSTVPAVFAASQLSIPITELSLVTNHLICQNMLMSKTILEYEEVLSNAQMYSEALELLLTGSVEEIQK